MFIPIAILVFLKYDYIVSFNILCFLQLKFAWDGKYSCRSNTKIYGSKSCWKYFSFVNPALSGRINFFGVFLFVLVIAWCWSRKWGRKTAARLLGLSKYMQTSDTDTVPLWLIMVQFYSVDTGFLVITLVYPMFNVQNMAEVAAMQICMIHLLCNSSLIYRNLNHFISSIEWLKKVPLSPTCKTDTILNLIWFEI